MEIHVISRQKQLAMAIMKFVGDMKEWVTGTGKVLKIAKFSVLNSEEMNKL